MTLIIGIICEDGIVVGADSMVTVGNDYSNIQMRSEKIGLFGDNGVAAFAGDVGLGQIVLDSLEEQRVTFSAAQNKNELKDNLTQAIGSALISYNNMSVNFGERINIPELLIALPSKDAPVLVRYSRAIPVLEATAGIHFLTAGSGAHLADSFLKFLEKIFWLGKPPSTIGKGVFSALWTLSHVIEANAVLGVDGPPLIAVLEKSSQEWNARVLPLEEHELHQQNIEAVEGSLSDFWKNLY